ncbi:ATP-binding protein [Christiangramia portivictoriae]|uniref:ATP-binding protein n=1 Tax=Christiangramia portivictoriae TaxID=326069 RepID=UPI0004227404|nr:ATP-binding protein [Christiangramia portivictoriae]
MIKEDKYPVEVDLSSCEKEPIHIIGTTQSHGLLIASNVKTGQITQVGENAGAIIGVDSEDLLKLNISEVLSSEVLQKINESLQKDERLEVTETSLNGQNFIIIPHISGDSLVLDIEPVHQKKDTFNFQNELSSLLNTLAASKDAQQLCQDAADLTREIFEYDRVMVYKFDDEWNGKVIAEAKKEDLETFLGLQYPASDIPKQARQLFFKNKVRIISDVNYAPVKITPMLDPSGDPLDISKSKLRGVSPIHIEYLQNMGVGSSLTAALISNGKLWGLLACHHSEAKFINYYQRQTCEFLIQIFSNELSLKSSNKYIQKLEEIEEVANSLMDQVIRQDSIKKGLSQSETNITSLMNASGAAIVLDGKIKLVGDAPTKKEVKSLIKKFLSKKTDKVFQTKNLLKFYPEAKAFTRNGSGILSTRLGNDHKNYIIWFRPEVIQQVSWGGDPNNKAQYDAEKERLTPRKSFEKWTEELSGVSKVWEDYEINGAKKLSENISYIILDNQKRSIDNLNEKLVAAHRELELFSQGLSHDLKAPLRGVDGYAHILKEDHFTNLDKEGRMAVDTILSSVQEMQDLIDNILSFAGVSNKDINKQVVSTDTMVKDIIRSFNIKSNYSNTSVSIDESLPKMMGDKRMLSQVWSNLIANALKYSERASQPSIEISYTLQGNKTVYCIKDNGIGFDPKYSEDIFNLFSRRSGDNYQGTGIGLAIVKKIIEKHNGEIWAESQPGSGSTFYFYV